MTNLFSSAEDLLTTEQAAERAGVTPDAIRRAVRDGRLLAIKVGPMYVIKASHLERYKPIRKPSRSSRGDR